MSDGHAATRKEKAVRCPYCNSQHVELISLFGQFLLTSQYFCRACHSAFEAVRKIESEQSDLPV